MRIPTNAARKLLANAFALAVLPGGAAASTDWAALDDMEKPNDDEWTIRIEQGSHRNHERIVIIDVDEPRQMFSGLDGHVEEVVTYAVRQRRPFPTASKVAIDRNTVD
ncbi:MAG: hypothetical protein ACE5FL_04485 [Myxococcota bacterium]